MNTFSINNSEIHTIYGVRATNREVLIKAIDNAIGHDFLLLHPDADYLRVTLPCVGADITYKTKKDVPNHSAPCPCGNLDHWLIKYDEEQKDNTLSKEEFEKGYAERSHLTLEELHNLGLFPVLCDCGDENCKGWTM